MSKMRAWKAIGSVIVMAAFWSNTSVPARADAHCFCSLACEDNTNYKGSPVKGWLWDAGSLATYSGPFQQGDANQTRCNTLCTDKIAAIWNAQNAASLACGHGCADGSAIRGWSKVGTREWKSAQMVGTLVNTPAQTQTRCTCPAGSRNGDWVDGGPVPVGTRCAAVVCDRYPTIPAGSYPPNNTQLGTWGFTWGTFIAQFVNATCTTTQTAAAICKIN